MSFYRLKMVKTAKFIEIDLPIHFLYQKIKKINALISRHNLH